MCIQKRAYKNTKLLNPQSETQKTEAQDPEMLSVPGRILKRGPENPSADGACSDPGSRDIGVSGLRGLENSI